MNEFTILVISLENFEESTERYGGNLIVLELLSSL